MSDPCMGGTFHLPCESDHCMCRCHRWLGEGPNPSAFDREHARQLIPKFRVRRLVADFVREQVAMALVTTRETERAAIAAELDRLADNYLRSPDTETNWRTVADAFYAAAERINPEVQQ